MSSALHTIRYPTGETEYRVIATAPEAGDVLTRNGARWLVERVTEGLDGSVEVTLAAGGGDIALDDGHAMT